MCMCLACCNKTHDNTWKRLQKGLQELLKNSSRDIALENLCNRRNEHTLKQVNKCFKACNVLNNMLHTIRTL